MKTEKQMTKIDQDLIDIKEDGQSGKYGSYVRRFAGHVNKLLKLKNPLDAGMLVYEIDSVLEIINPDLEDEVKWLKNFQKHLKIYSNERVIANRLLGIKNDNEYDVRGFEEAIMDVLHVTKKPNHSTIIKTDWKTLILLVETGARRFGK